MENKWKIIKQDKNETIYQYGDMSESRVIHYANGRIGANCDISFHMVYESPEIFIEKSCVNACKALWELNISTRESGEDERGNDYIVLDELSDENFEIFKNLTKQEPRIYRFEENNWKFGKNACFIVSPNKEEISTSLVDKFKMQDITQGFMSSELFLMNYCGCKDYEYQYNPPRRICFFNPTKQEKSLKEYLKEQNMDKLYIEKEDRIYENQFYLDRHMKYLETIKGAKMEYETPKNYDEFIATLKALPTQEAQLAYLAEYFKREVEYNYDVLIKSKSIMKDGIKITPSETVSRNLDSEFDCSNPQAREQAIAKFKTGMEAYGLPVTDNFMKKLLEHYGKEFIIPAQPAREADGFCLATPACPESKSFREFWQALNLVSFPAEYESGLIKKGVCADYSDFIRKVCKDIGVEVSYVSGDTPTSHAWNLIEINGEKKHFDITYSLFVRDKYLDWDKKAKFEDFLGTSFEKLKKLNPLRTINNIDGKPVLQDKGMEK